MATFTLDTSGYVQCPAPDQKPNESTGCWFWSSLSPFCQGYVEALFASLQEAETSADGDGHEGVYFAKFSDLAPEALSKALYRCEFRLTATQLPVGYTAEDGRIFWDEQQRGELSYFPPQTVTLSDDGKVCLMEASRG